MTTLTNTRVGLEAQPCPRKQLEMRTGLCLVADVIPLCLVGLTVVAQEGSNQHKNSGKEECAL